MLVDSHCHLNYKDFDGDFEEVLARAAANDVAVMQTISTTIAEFDEVHGIAKAHDNIFCSVGVHPSNAEKEPDIKKEEIVERTKNPKVIGIGETGLDYYYEYSPKDIQRKSFATHIDAAMETGLPLIIHTRDAEDDTAEILKDAMNRGGVTGLLHCFTGTWDLASKALDMGFYISLSGIVTFKNAKELHEVAKQVPLDRLLVETDAPYLAPVPHRGKRNEPAYTRHTAEFIAELKGISYEELAEATTNNFFTLFSKAKRPEAA